MELFRWVISKNHSRNAGIIQEMNKTSWKISAMFILNISGFEFRIFYKNWPKLHFDATQILKLTYFKIHLILKKYVEFEENT